MPLAAVAGTLALAASAAGGGTRMGGAGPAWSPDGTQIVYLAGGSRLDRAAVVAADGPGAPHLVVTVPRGEALAEIRWGAGGRFVYSDSNYTLWSDTGTRGRSPTRLATLGVTSGAGESFALSPDGREVAFTAPCACGVAQGDTVGVVPVAGGKARILVRAKNVLAAYPSFSPDGTRVAFTRTRIGPAAPAYPANTSLVVETLRTEAQRVLHVFGQWTSFSPDGRRLAFLGRHGLEVMPAGGGRPRTLLALHYVDGTASFSWSPNGRTLAYATATRAGTIGLSRHAATFALAGLRPDLHTPEWSPDGATLAFSAVARGDDLDRRVYVIRGDGSGLRRIA